MNIRYFPQPGRSVLLLYDGTPSQIENLLQLIRKLSNRELSLIELHSLEGMINDSKIQVILERIDEGPGILKKTNEGYYWSASADEWDHIFDLVLSLSRPWEAGHQTLASNKEMDLIISAGLGW